MAGFILQYTLIWSARFASLNLKEIKSNSSITATASLCGIDSSGWTSEKAVEKAPPPFL